jgi:hypothetical protein
MPMDVRVGALAAVAAAFLLVSAGCAQVPLADQAKYAGKRQPLHEETRIGQEFGASDRNLNRVDVFLYPSKLMKSELSPRESNRVKQRLLEKNVVLVLYDKPGGRKLATAKRSAATITEKGLYAFKFGPIADSKHKRYYFELRAPDLTEQSAIAVALTNVDRYDGGRAYVNGEPLEDSDMRFQPYIRMNTRMLANSMAARLWSDRLFMAVWGLIVTAVLVVVIDSWRRAGGAVPDGKNKG